ncbi:MAG: hypothetical protein IJ488_03130 [Clostridia bacterium]|nr:hypothetical protein [Clostridia bacterium]
MTEKNEYNRAQVNLILLGRQDIITASGNATLGSEGEDDGGWTAGKT